MGRLGRRAAWSLLAVVLVGAAVAAAWWTGHILRAQAGERPPRPPGVKDWPPAEPFGPFRGTRAGDGRLWRWASAGGALWRQALIVQPPARLEGSALVPSDGTLRIYLALPPEDTEGDEWGAVLVRAAATDAAGHRVGLRSRVLGAECDRGRLDDWVELSLRVDAPPRTRVKLALEALPAGPDRDRPLPRVAVAAPATTSPGSNCIVILVDTLRPDRLHCYGCPLIASRNIDRLAGQGVLFENAVSTSSWTVPAVASLFTGTCVSTHGMARFRMPGRLTLTTLAQVFRAAGARTAAVSANAFIFPPAGFGVGFDEFVFPEEFSIRYARDPSAAWVTDQAVALLRRLAGGRFFIYLHYMDPHHPYTPPAPFATFGSRSERRYLGEIAYVDSEVGRLLDELDRLGLSADTLVVFTADHGEAFLEHGQLFHGYTLHREEVQVPLIMRYPGRIPEGVRVGTRVRTIDLFPTLAELLGLDTPRQLEGESLVPLWRDGTDAADRTAVSELYQREGFPAKGNWVALEEGRWKLILRLDTGRRLLYDVERDPGERKDLSGREEAKAAAMERSIRRFLRTHRDLRGQGRVVTEAERERLRALGYLAPAGGTR